MVKDSVWNGDYNNINERCILVMKLHEANEPIIPDITRYFTTPDGIQRNDRYEL